MSERKESLLRTLELQHEQLSQWERKRTIARDPDERQLCDDKIKDIKALIAEGETELKKLKGGRPGKQAPVNPVNNSIKYIERNEIGFNADRHFSDNSSGHEVSGTASLNELGDDFDPGEIKISPASNTAINTVGNNTMDREYETNIPVQNPGNSRETKQAAKPRNDISMWAIGVVSLIIFMAGISKSLGKNFELVKTIVGGIVAIAIIWLVYLYLQVTKGLKFTIAMLILTCYGGLIFWDTRILQEVGDSGGKKVGEVVILPMIIAGIGVLLTLVNEEYKKK